jgi:hypothetical protein
MFLQFSLVHGGKRENRLDDSGTCERMEVSRDSFGSLKSYKNFTRPLRFCSTNFY